MLLSFRNYKKIYCATNIEENVVKVRERVSYVKIDVCNHYTHKPMKNFFSNLFFKV